MFGYSVFQLYANFFKDLVRCIGIYDRDNGFGKDIDWTETLEESLQKAQNEQKPIMLIIHKSWCSACRKLKPQFASSSTIQSLSQNFVMVNLMDDMEPKDSQYAPDGNYIPRILFLSPEGKVYFDVYNDQGNPKYKYFYSRTDPIIEAMNRVHAKVKSNQ